MHSSVGSASTFAASAASMSAGTTVACVTPSGLSSLHLPGEKSGSGTSVAPTPSATRSIPAPAWWWKAEAVANRDPGPSSIGPADRITRFAIGAWRWCTGLGAPVVPDVWSTATVASPGGSMSSSRPTVVNSSGTTATGRLVRVTHLLGHRSRVGRGDDHRRLEVTHARRELPDREAGTEWRERPLRPGAGEQQGERRRNGRDERRNRTAALRALFVEPTGS